MTVNINITFSLDITPFNLVDGHQRRFSLFQVNQQVNKEREQTGGIVVKSIY
jgi:hypothetical protein